MKKIDKKLFDAALTMRYAGALSTAILLSACSSSPLPNY
jgi:hypothetical protein